MMYIRKVRVVEERLEVWEARPNVKPDYIERDGRCQQSILLKSDTTVHELREATEVEQKLWENSANEN